MESLGLRRRQRPTEGTGLGVWGGNRPAWRGSCGLGTGKKWTGQVVLRDCAPGFRREVATYLAGVAGLGSGEETEAGGGR